MIFGIIVVALFLAIPGAAVIAAFVFLGDQAGIVALALVMMFVAALSLLGDLLQRSREDWREAVMTRDGRIILALGAVTLIITIAMMVGAHLQILA